MQSTINKLECMLCRRINVDTIAGFEARLKSSKACPPEHIKTTRWADWMEGFDAATRYLSTRQTHFVGQTVQGSETRIIRKGWVSRGKIISMMERGGVRGDVHVTYLDVTGIVRQICSGI